MIDSGQRIPRSPSALTVGLPFPQNFWCSAAPLSKDGISHQNVRARTYQIRPFWIHRRPHLVLKPRFRESPEPTFERTAGIKTPGPESWVDMSRQNPYSKCPESESGVAGLSTTPARASPERVVSDEGEARTPLH
jgi:hypothetical protein